MNQRFGGFHLDRKLAQGGMAEIFLATHLKSGQKMVLKRLLPELENRRDVIDLFLTEADVGQLLNHPNIVQIMDTGEVHGIYYIAMEFMDGLDLRQLLKIAKKKKKPLSMAWSFRIVIDCLKGLHHAHQLSGPNGDSLGLVHRDVSPDNIFISKTGHIKVADFGIAKLASLEEATQIGLLKGKLSYMSPEQIKQKKLDGRADQFAMALILYEALTAKKPFAANKFESEIQRFKRVRSGKVAPILQINPDVPISIAKIVHKALKPWRFLRYKDCLQFAENLEAEAQKLGLLATHEDLKTGLKHLV